MQIFCVFPSCCYKPRSDGTNHSVEVTVTFLKDLHPPHHPWPGWPALPSAAFLDVSFQSYSNPDHRNIATDKHVINRGGFWLIYSYGVRVQYSTRQKRGTSKVVNPTVGFLSVAS